MTGRQRVSRSGLRSSLAARVIVGGALLPIALVVLTPSEAVAAPLPPPGDCSLPTDQLLPQLEASLDPVGASINDNLEPTWAAVNNLYLLPRAVVCLPIALIGGE